MEEGKLTLFVRTNEWPEALSIGEALKLQPDDVYGALFDALLAANDDARDSDLVLQLMLRNTFRHTLKHYYFAPEAASKLLAVLRACYNNIDTESLEYLFYKIGGIPAVIALFLEAAANPAIPHNIKNLHQAEIEGLVKYICDRPRNISIDQWIENKAYLLQKLPPARHKVRGIRGRPKKSPRVKNDLIVKRDPKVDHDAKAEDNPNVGHDLKLEQARHDLKDEQVPPPNKKRKPSLDPLPLESSHLSQAQHNAPYQVSQTSNPAYTPSAEHPITTPAPLSGYFSTGQYFYGDNGSGQAASSLPMDVDQARQVLPQSCNQSESQGLNMPSSTYTQTTVLVESRRSPGQENYSQQHQQQQQQQYSRPIALTAPDDWTTRRVESLQENVGGFDGETGHEDYAQEQQQYSRPIASTAPDDWTTRRVESLQESVGGFDGEIRQEDYAQQQGFTRQEENYAQHHQHYHQQYSRLTAPTVPNDWTVRQAGFLERNVADFDGHILLDQGQADTWLRLKVINS